MFTDSYILLNILVAEFTPSVASTGYDPAADDGTVNDVINFPEELVVIADVIIVPLYFSVILDLLANPLPVTETIVPPGPLVGDMKRAGCTVNVLVAEFTPSVASTGCGPTADVSIVNDAENPPKLFANMVGGVVTTVVPPYFRVMVEPIVNPLPVTVTRLPTVPLFGDNNMEGDSPVELKVSNVSTLPNP